MGRGIAAGIALALGACGFSLNPGSALESDAPLAIDAPPPDGGSCTSVSQTCADGGTLRICPAAGADSYDTPCLWKCVPGTPDHCGVLTPSGGGLVATDLTLSGLSDVVLGTVTINSDTGNVSGMVAGTFDWRIANGISVFRASSIRFNGPVTLRGTRAMAFAANGDIAVAGLIDAQGSCQLTAAGPGGFPGGEYHVDGSGMGGGGLGGQNAGAGAGGGGHGAIGGVGGMGDGIAGTSGAAYGDAEITMLVGGSGGGGGGGGGGNNNVGVGGGGGGAIQLASNRSIRIEIAGGINAGGCGGKGSNNDQNDGAGGGGAGGAILLEAPVVDVSGVLAVNGGGGGAAEQSSGAAGGPTRAAALGGEALVDGGLGGFALSLPGEAGANSTLTGGGGGGGVGRIRINTRNGNVMGGGVLSPSYTDIPTTTTKDVADVE